jgi:signal transduction histidine kinase
MRIAERNVPTVTASEVVDRLAAHKTLGAAPRAELEWLAAHGFLRDLKTGESIAQKGKPIEGMWIVLSGRLAIFVDRGTGPKKMMEWQAGDVSGMLPYSRLVSPPGDSLAQELTTIYELPVACIRAMTRECYEVTAILVHKMLDRARIFNASDLHDEKMVSLGKLSAGLAHELNNPASAIERSATLLEDRLKDAEVATRALGAARLTEAQLAAVDAARASCMAKRIHGVRSPIEEAEREEKIADWLAAHELDGSTAEPLAETQITIEALDMLAAVVSGPVLNAVLRWAAAGCSVRGLAAEIQDAAMRISGLVIAVKGFTHMDQAMVAEPVDLAQGLSNTIVVLGAKARGKQVAVVLDVEDGLPQARGFAGELNQIWANLLDNALDAVAPAGRVEVKAKSEGSHVVVRILDNGPGIPAEIRERIFDPFFTTKAMGQGTGLGLDIVRRLIRHNDGEITVQSQAGHTEFRVELPQAVDGGGMAQ